MTTNHNTLNPIHRRLSSMVYLFLKNDKNAIVELNDKHKQVYFCEYNHATEHTYFDSSIVNSSYGTLYFKCLVDGFEQNIPILYAAVEYDVRLNKERIDTRYVNKLYSKYFYDLYLEAEFMDNIDFW